MIDFGCRQVAVALSSILALLSISSVSATPLTLCSKHVLPFNAAVAHFDSPDRSPLAEGWYIIPPRGCHPPIEVDVEKPVFLFAFDGRFGGLRRSGNALRLECIGNQPFSIRTGTRGRRSECDSQQHRVEFFRADVAAGKSKFEFRGFEGVELCNGSGRTVQAVYSARPFKVGTSDPFDYEPGSTGWLTIPSGHCAIVDGQQTRLEMGYWFAYSRGSDVVRWPSRQYEITKEFCVDYGATGQFKLVEPLGEERLCSLRGPLAHIQPEEFGIIQRLLDPNTNSPSAYRITLEGADDDDRPLRMLPPRHSGNPSAADVGQALKVFCTAKDTTGRPVSLTSTAAVDPETADCVALRIDHYHYYSINVPAGDAGSSRTGEVCGLNEDAIKQACAQFKVYQSEFEGVAKDLTNDRDGFKRAGFKLGAWYGGMSPADAARARRGEVNAPIEAYIGEQAGEGFYNALQKNGAYDRAALLLFPGHTTADNSPAGQAFARGDVAALGNMAADIFKDELTAWSNSRAKEIRDKVRQVREADERLVKEKEALERRAKDAESCVRTPSWSSCGGFFKPPSPF